MVDTVRNVGNGGNYKVKNPDNNEKGKNENSSSVQFQTTGDKEADLKNYANQYCNGDTTLAKQQLKSDSLDKSNGILTINNTGSIFSSTAAATQDGGQMLDSLMNYLDSSTIEDLDEDLAAYANKMGMSVDEAYELFEALDSDETEEESSTDSANATNGTATDGATSATGTSGTSGSSGSSKQEEKVSGNDVWTLVTNVLSKLGININSDELTTVAIKDKVVSELSDISINDIQKAIDTLKA